MGKSTVKITPKIISKNKMIMREYVGKATSESETIQLSNTIGTRAPIVEFPDGRKVVFSWEELIVAAEQALALEGVVE